jgi:hypothetical protein
MALLVVFESCFTAPTFRTFCAMMAGLVAQAGPRTVCGMLVGAGLSRAWAHDRAHRFFSHARWSPQQVGLVLARLVVALLIPEGEPVTVVIDDTLFRRRGTKVWAVSWFHDGSGTGKDKVGRGNTWVIAGILVHLAMMSRPVCLPVLARLVIKDTTSASRLWLARQMTQALAGALPGRLIHAVADAAYPGGELRELPHQVSWTTRPRTDAALYDLAPSRTGKRGRPRTKGTRLGSLTTLADTTAFTPATVCRYGIPTTVGVATLPCLWYSVFGSRPVQVVLLREPGTRHGYDLALITTDTTTGPATVIERYAARWSVEVAIEDAKQLLGTGQARNPPRHRATTHRPLRPDLPDHDHALVHHRRLPPRRHHRASQPDPLVPREVPALHHRHDHQTPPSPHRRQISASSPPSAYTRGNPHHPPGLGHRRRITAKVELVTAPSIEELAPL